MTTLDTCAITKAVHLTNLLHVIKFVLPVLDISDLTGRVGGTGWVCFYMVQID